METCVCFVCVLQRGSELQSADGCSQMGEQADTTLEATHIQTHTQHTHTHYDCLSLRTSTAAGQALDYIWIRPLV